MWTGSLGLEVNLTSFKITLSPEVGSSYGVNIMLESINMLPDPSWPALTGGSEVSELTKKNSNPSLLPQWGYLLK